MTLLGLRSKQGAVFLACAQQLGVSAVRCDPPAVENQDARQIHDRTDPMSDNDHRSMISFADQFLID